MIQRVLVVDDQPSITTTLSLVLHAAGFEVRTANSGAEALDIAERFGPDALITDYAMPGMNGLQLATQVIRRFPGCRVIVFSGHTHVAIPENPRFQFLMKPVRPNVFIDMLKSGQAEAGSTVERAPRVLHVDDVDSHRYSVARLLRLAGFEVVERTSGSDALSDDAREADLILLDVGLPDISGVDVCRKLKTQPETADIPVILVTASHFEQPQRDLSLGLGAYDYITEPFDPDHLLKQVRSAIQLRYLESSNPSKPA